MLIMLFSIVIGLVVWLVVPKLFSRRMKRNRREALTLLCKIVGIAIIVCAVLGRFHLLPF